MTPSDPLLVAAATVMIFIAVLQDKEVEPARTANPAADKKPATVEPTAAPAPSAQEIKAQIRAMVDALPISKSTRDYYATFDGDPTRPGYVMDISKVLAGLLLFRAASEQRQEVGTIYSLAGLRVVQKVNGGYLMRPPQVLVLGEPEAPLVFLNTTTNLPENFQFSDLGHFARYAGVYQCQALNGFSQSTYQFEMFSDEVNRWVLERLLMKPSTRPLKAAAVTPAMDAVPAQALHARAEAAAYAWLKRNLPDADSLEIVKRTFDGDDEVACVVVLEYKTKSAYGRYNVEKRRFTVQHGEVAFVSDPSDRW